MDPGRNQLKKIRTFHSDMERLRPSSKAETLKPSTSPNLPKPSVNLPPVMAPKKALPPIPAKEVPVPVVKSPTTPLPEQAVTATPTFGDKVEALLPNVPENNLTTKVARELNDIKTKSAFESSDRINMMDTDSEITEGAIITDQKRDRFKFFPSLINSLMGWFQEEKEAIEERAEQKRLAIPTVSAVEGRKQVLEKAAQTSALAPKDDHEDMASKLPAGLSEQAASAKQAVVITKKDPAAKPSWSHFEGEDNPEPTKVTPAPNQNTIAEKDIFSTVAEPVLPPPPVKVKAQPPAPAPEVPSVPPTSVAVKAKTKPEVAKVEPIEIEIKSKPVASEEQRKWRPTPKQKTNWRIPRSLVYVTAALVALVAAGGGVAVTTSILGQNQGMTPGPSLVQPAGNQTGVLLSQDRSVKLALPRSRSLIYEAMTENMQATGGITVFTWTISQNGIETPASSDEVLSSLSFEASPAFLRSINDINLGTLGNTPFIVTKVTSFDTAFGGLLAAEENLNSDLAPLFETTMYETLNTNTATSTLPARKSFVDDVVRNHDVRVLRGDLDDELIVYGFVNQNTVVITVDRATFATIAEAIQ